VGYGWPLRGRAIRWRGRARARTSPSVAARSSNRRWPPRRWPGGTRRARRRRGACSGPTPGIVEARAHRVGLEDLAVPHPGGTATGPRAGRRDAPGDRGAVLTRFPTRGRPASTPTSRASVSRNPANVPMAFDRPRRRPSRVGVAPSSSRHCAWASSRRPVGTAHDPRVGVGPDDGTDAVVGLVSTLATQSRNASLMASFRWRCPTRRDHLGTEESASARRSALGARLDAPMNTMHSSPNSAGGGRGGDAVLAGAGLGREPCFAHLAGQEGLTSTLLILWSRWGEVFALEEDAHPEPLGQATAFGGPGWGAPRSWRAGRRTVPELGRGPRGAKTPPRASSRAGTRASGMNDRRTRRSVRDRPARGPGMRARPASRAGVGSPVMLGVVVALAARNRAATGQARSSSRQS